MILFFVAEAVLDALTPPHPSRPGPGGVGRGRGNPSPKGKREGWKMKRPEPPTPRGLVGLASKLSVGAENE
eukprot:1578395-Pyramimonas_sp.AAC.1